MCKRAIMFLCLWGSLTLVYGQEKSISKWSILTGYEVNYTGNNAIIHGQFRAYEKHLIEAGLNYNFSDGFTNKPVLGVGLAYRYEIVQHQKWRASLGVDYRRQKPLKFVNIQTITYSNMVSYDFTTRFTLYTNVGYGVAAERAASAGSFSQSNNITGLASLGCVIHF